MSATESPIFDKYLPRQQRGATEIVRGKREFKFTRKKLAEVRGSNGAAVKRAGQLQSRSLRPLIKIFPPAFAKLIFHRRKNQRVTHGISCFCPSIVVDIYFCFRFVTGFTQHTTAHEQKSVCTLIWNLNILSADRIRGIPRIEDFQFPLCTSLLKCLHVIGRVGYLVSKFN